MCIHTFVSQKVLFVVINNSITQVVEFHEITQEQFGQNFTLTWTILIVKTEWLQLESYLRDVNILRFLHIPLYIISHASLLDFTSISTASWTYILWVLSSRTNFPWGCLWVHIVISSVCMAYKFCLKHKSVTHTYISHNPGCLLTDHRLHCCKLLRNWQKWHKCCPHQCLQTVHSMKSVDHIPWHHLSCNRHVLCVKVNAKFWKE
jgi:hypothetical protein